MRCTWEGDQPAAAAARPLRRAALARDRAGAGARGRCGVDACGSGIEALLREAILIRELRPEVNVQVGAPDLLTRDVPRALVRDAIVLVPSIEEDSAELVAARVDGGCLLQRTRRNGADLGVHAVRLRKFFAGRDDPRHSMPGLAPLVFSWLAGRGAGATRLDPHDAPSPRALRARLAALLGAEELFAERLVIYS